MTNEERTKRGMSHFPCCELCGAVLESALHAVRDYSSAQSVWKTVLPREFWNRFFNFPIEKWILWNLKNEGNYAFIGGQWEVFFGITCWFIWKSRNDAIFNKANMNTGDIISSAIARTKSLQIGKANSRWACNTTSLNSWQKPAVGWTKIDVDGSLSRGGSRAAIGGVGRRPSGDWLFGFKMSVSITDIFQIEAKVILEGLRLAWNKGVKQVKLESDNDSLIEFLQTSLVSMSSVVEIRLIHDLYLKDLKVKFKCIRKSFNKVTDRLARLNSSEIGYLTVLEKQPQKIKALLEENARSSFLKGSISS